MKIFPSLKQVLPSMLLLALLGNGHHVSAQSLKDSDKAEIPKTAAQWRQAALSDINSAYQTTLKHHPGTYDPYNQGFQAKLDLAKKQSLALAEKVAGVDGYIATLMKFNAGIQDGHAGVYSKLDPKLFPKKRWPGFVTVWRGDGLYVYASEGTTPVVGAKVIACDGIAINTLIAKNIFSFKGRINEAGRWWTLARTVLEDYGNPFIKLPQRCEFNFAGKTFEQSLSWKTRTQQANQWFRESYNGDKLPVGLTEPRNKLFWAAMPTFSPNEHERNNYRLMTTEIENNRQLYLNADAIVIDLRHNTGGSSQWSQDFAAALWGKEPVKQFMDTYSAKTQVWWRATQANTEYMTALIDTLSKQKQKDMVDWARKNSAGMQAALVRGENFYKELKTDEAVHITASQARFSSAQAVFTKPVYVIVPGQCPSACLDALDVFTQFANTKLIGAPSSADSTYMEVRYQELESGLAGVIIPMKVYVNRPRGNGQSYSPDIFVNDLVWSSDNFLAVIEEDLATRKP